jgi:DNA-directed RNA polymerase subunit L
VWLRSIPLKSSEGFVFMVYIYFDESGDLGFDTSKNKTSKYFIATFLLTKNPRPLNTTVNKIFKTFSKKEIKVHMGYLHAFSEKEITVKRLLTNSVKHDISIMMLWLDKTKVYTRLKNEPHKLYNYLTNILIDRLTNTGIIKKKEKVIFVASQRETSEYLNADFSYYINHKHKNKIDIEIQIKSPRQCKPLQIVDFISWSFYQKYEYNNLEFVNIFQNKIISENPLYKY